MKQPSGLAAVTVALLASALAAVVATWLVSLVMIKVGITGMMHTVTLMLVMPLSFAVVALLVARKVLLK